MLWAMTLTLLAPVSFSTSAMNSFRYGSAWVALSRS